eukprot:gb/GECH01006362.1/.p1 GENE.gb/GECH01006362.1/~~gb/GECH01006362.1/.p1  ORF type:complete len:215 (+),score=49.75 gb/GECH01006362.1/:1-645(+)
MGKDKDKAKKKNRRKTKRVITKPKAQLKGTGSTAYKQLYQHEHDSFKLLDKLFITIDQRRKWLLEEETSRDIISEFMKYVVNRRLPPSEEYAAYLFEHVRHLLPQLNFHTPNSFIEYDRLYSFKILNIPVQIKLPQNFNEVNWKMICFFIGGISVFFTLIYTLLHLRYKWRKQAQQFYFKHQESFRFHNQTTLGINNTAKLPRRSLYFPIQTIL